MAADPSAPPALGPGGPAPVDTAGIAANIQKAYAASKAAGTPLSDADLEAYARRESGGTLGLQELADWHAAKSAPPVSELDQQKAAFLAAHPALDRAHAFGEGLTRGVTYGGIRAAEGPDQLAEAARHPIWSKTGEFIGMAGSPVTRLIGALANLVPGAGLGTSVARGAINAGVGSGAYAAGSTAGDLPTRLKAGAEAVPLGTAIGVGGAGLLTPAIGAAQRFLSPAARIAATTTGDEAAARAAAMQAAGRGGIMTGADIAPQAAQQAAAASPDAAKAIAAAQAVRTQEAPERVLADVRAAIQSHATPAVPDPLASVRAKILALKPNATEAEIAYGAKQMGVNTAPGVADPKVEEAIKAANKGWHAIDPSEMMRLIAPMEPEQRQIVRQTIANQLLEQLESAGTQRKAAEELIEGARPGSIAEQKLQVAFPDKATFDNIMERMEVERAMVPGSRPPAHVMATLSELIRGGSIAGAVWHAAPQVLHNPVAAATTLATGAIPAAAMALNRNVAGRVGGLLAQQGPDAIQALIGQIRQSAPGALHPAIQAGLAATGGLLRPQGQAPGQSTGLLGPPVMGP